MKRIFEIVIYTLSSILIALAVYLIIHAAQQIKLHG